MDLAIGMGVDDIFMVVVMVFVWWEFCIGGYGGGSSYWGVFY